MPRTKRDPCRFSSETSLSCTGKSIAQIILPGLRPKNPAGCGQRPPGKSAGALSTLLISNGSFRVLSGRCPRKPRRGSGQSRAGFTSNPGGFPKKPAEARVRVRAPTRSARAYSRMYAHACVGVARHARYYLMEGCPVAKCVLKYTEPERK